MEIKSSLHKERRGRRLSRHHLTEECAGSAGLRCGTRRAAQSEGQPRHLCCKPGLRTGLPVSRGRSEVNARAQVPAARFEHFASICATESRWLILIWDEVFPGGSVTDSGAISKQRSRTALRAASPLLHSIEPRYSKAQPDGDQMVRSDRAAGAASLRTSGRMMSGPSK
ncbi:hypothetical protein FQA47_008383 [Oryzias melastigma]|uniref:Uncharacterized protein n=1 Tax=Oryzias melastigma TaxID=30732 RepID=A0A834CHS5_ORYME|nr:hypothetical protein FQA47_008383 [Oryzias melastigma]